MCGTVNVKIMLLDFFIYVQVIISSLKFCYMFLCTCVCKISKFIHNIYNKILTEYKSKNVCAYEFVHGSYHYSNISNQLDEAKKITKGQNNLGFVNSCTTNFDYLQYALGYQHPPVSCQASPLNSANCPSSPFLRNPPFILAFRETHLLLNIGFFCEA